jgi:hypothetical protein
MFESASIGEPKSRLLSPNVVTIYSAYMAGFNAKLEPLNRIFNSLERGMTADVNSMTG